MTKKDYADYFCDAIEQSAILLNRTVRQLSAIGLQRVITSESSKALIDDKTFVGLLYR